MPKIPIDYTKSLIYKIVCKDLNIKDLYVGSTTDFRQRKATHKIKSKSSEFNVYKFIRDNGGWDNWEMIEIEKYPCIDSNSKTKRERELKEELKANLNTKIPNRTSKEWFEDNKEYRKDYKKQYRIDNNEYIHIYNKEYYQKSKKPIL